MSPQAIRFLADSAQLVEPLRNTTSAAAREIIEEVIRDAASVDGDRCLDQFEAEALQTAYFEVMPGGGAVSVEDAEEIRTAAQMQLEQLRSERPKSTDVLFTSEGGALSSFRDAILGSVEKALEKADGRPVEFNAMVFSFTDVPIADGLLKLARENPNLTIRVVTDWSQLSLSGSHQPPRLARIAAEEGLTNFQVKFKKDNPYVWSDTAGRPKYNHSATKGLNHHKGFSLLIDGQVERVGTGSFNWSKSAMKSNYENLMLLDRSDHDNRPVLEGYEAEFGAFWNNGDVALSYNEARREKNRIYQALHEANGVDYNPRNVPDDDVDMSYERVLGEAQVDVNSFTDADVRRLQSMIGKRNTYYLQRELKKYGRFDNFDELVERVPRVGSLRAEVLEELVEFIEFGDGGLSINTASVSELDRAGVSKKVAERIVAFREEHGAFESLDELDDIRGIGKRTVAKLRDVFTDDQNIGVFSARVPGGDAMTGYADDNHRTVSVPSAGNMRDVDAQPSGDVVPAHRDDMTDLDANLSSVVIDLLRRAQPGQTFRMAMYGLSTSTPEFAEIRAAVARGVKVRAVLYKSYNGKAIDALKEMRDEGLDVDVKIISGKVMHEKFGTVGDDVFNGSANMSGSSSSKHSEDRFLFRNMPQLASRFSGEFARLWNKAKTV